MPVGWSVGDGQRSGGAVAWRSRVDQAASQGQFAGRCRRSRRPEVAIRAGTVISFRRIVAVVADLRSGPVMVAAVRVRLKAITASTSQAAFAVNFPDGRCASAERWVCLVNGVSGGFH